MNPTAPVKAATVNLGPVRPYVVQRSRRVRQSEQERKLARQAPWKRDPRYIGQ